MAYGYEPDGRYKTKVTKVTEPIRGTLIVPGKSLILIELQGDRETLHATNIC